jgi:hypothetical protein
MTQDLEQREKDYQIAVEIGKMLLDKNKDLDDEKEVLRQQYEQTVSHVKKRLFLCQKSCHKEMHKSQNF